MIHLVEGNIFDIKPQAIANAVNCVGVMGKGIALEFKKRYPNNFIAYRDACRKNEVKTGSMFVFEYTNPSAQPRFIINFPTKQDWRDKSSLSIIQAGLDSLVDVIHERDIKSIALPALGAGLGGLSWSSVKPLLVERLTLDNVEVTIFEPMY